MKICPNPGCKNAHYCNFGQSVHIYWGNVCTSTVCTCTPDQLCKCVYFCVFTVQRKIQCVQLLLFCESTLTEKSQISQVCFVIQEMQCICYATEQKETWMFCSESSNYDYLIISTNLNNSWLMLTPRTLESPPQQGWMRTIGQGGKWMRMPSAHFHLSQEVYWHTWRVILKWWIELLLRWSNGPESWVCIFLQVKKCIDTPKESLSGG